MPEGSVLPREIHPPATHLASQQSKTRQQQHERFLLGDRCQQYGVLEPVLPCIRYYGSVIVNIGSIDNFPSHSRESRIDDVVNIHHCAMVPQCRMLHGCARVIVQYAIANDLPHIVDSVSNTFAAGARN